MCIACRYFSDVADSIDQSRHINRPDFRIPQAKLPINIANLDRFLLKIQNGYLDNPYHNKVHAADVVQVRADCSLPSTGRFAILQVLWFSRRRLGRCSRTVPFLPLRVRTSSFRDQRSTPT